MSIAVNHSAQRVSGDSVCTLRACDAAGDECHVALLDPPPLEGSSERRGRLPRFGNYKASTRLSIKPVNKPGLLSRPPWSVFEDVLDPCIQVHTLGSHVRVNTNEHTHARMHSRVNSICTHEPTTPTPTSTCTHMPTSTPTPTPTPTPTFTHTHMGNLGSSLHRDSAGLVDHNALRVLKEHSPTHTLDVAYRQPQCTRTGVRCRWRVPGCGEELAVHLHQLPRHKAPRMVSLPHPRPIALQDFHLARADELLHKRKGHAWALLREKPIEPSGVGGARAKHGAALGPVVLRSRAGAHPPPRRCMCPGPFEDDADLGIGLALLAHAASCQRH